MFCSIVEIGIQEPLQKDLAYTNDPTHMSKLYLQCDACHMVSEPSCDMQAFRDPAHSNVFDALQAAKRAVCASADDTHLQEPDLRMLNAEYHDFNWDVSGSLVRNFATNLAGPGRFCLCHYADDLKT